MRKEFIGGNEALVIARDSLGRPQLFRQGETDLDLEEALPFRDYPGIPAPRDKVKDATILNVLKSKGNGELPRRGQILDYEQSAALFNVVNQHFANEMPLMNTERWLARYVQDNDLTYTDHDGRRYKMKDGWRYPVSSTPHRSQNIELDENEEDSDEEDLEKIYLVEGELT